MESHAFAYLTGIIVVSETLDEHVAYFHQVYQHLRYANQIGHWSVKYLWHVITKEGIHTDLDKMKADTDTGNTCLPRDDFLVP